ncbi:DUF4148 domain-containing protein [Paucibacter sp. APW11]|uniref:DUF4148 domain-containing protein n=1 Tax=Roseateles aquae TaxID=3077235 RepID=A0ABU3PF44_9BURK|nr:DUF4148 domain-containing protein [Paucibacter sp. APW11]MDT9001230.1 DUF4148 domain-containing protein [Paucibacter sp. APW11]
MNKLNIAAIALTLLASSGAFAQELSREQVKAELQRARASGELAAMNSDDTATFGAALKPSSTALAASKTPAAEQVAPKAATKAEASKTRAEVIAELKRARETGELEYLNAEGGPGNYPVARSQVVGEPVMAGKSPAKLN